MVLSNGASHAETQAPHRSRDPPIGCQKRRSSCLSGHCPRVQSVPGIDAAQGQLSLVAPIYSMSRAEPKGTALLHTPADAHAAGEDRDTQMTVPSSISHSVQQTQEWLKALCEAGSYSGEAEAFAALRAVLHQLRDRLTPTEAVDLAAQLPMIVRGVYYEGWQPLRTPEKVRTREDFLAGVRGKLGPHPISPENATRDVFSLLAQAIDSGEIADVISQMPAEIKELWPTGMRSWAEVRAHK